MGQASAGAVAALGLTVVDATGLAGAAEGAVALMAFGKETVIASGPCAGYIDGSPPVRSAGRIVFATTVVPEDPYKFEGERAIVGRRRRGPTPPAPLLGAQGGSRFIVATRGTEGERERNGKEAPRRRQGNGREQESGAGSSVGRNVGSEGYDGRRAIGKETRKDADTYR